MKNKKFSLPKISFREIPAEKKKETLSNSLVFVAALVVIALLLGGVHNLLNPVISGMAESKLIGEMEKIIPARKYNKLDFEFDKADSIISAYEAKNGTELIGYCIETQSQGYEGPIRILVGLDAEGVVSGVEILSINETTGYGSRVNDKTFLSQFEGKSKELTLVRGKADTDEKILAISGATVSSNAIKNGVNNAVAAVSQVRADAEAAAKAEAEEKARAEAEAAAKAAETEAETEAEAEEEVAE